MIDTMTDVTALRAEASALLRQAIEAVDRHQWGEATRIGREYREVCERIIDLDGKVGMLTPYPPTSAVLSFQGPDHLHLERSK